MLTQTSIKVSTNSVLPQGLKTETNLAEQTLSTINTESKEEIETSETTVTESSVTTPETEPENIIAPVSEQITSALAWLGKQSLDEYKLTYPPKDNAYYYYSRLLELQPDNRAAYEGILAIAERYVILAERSLAANELEKTRTYVEIGLQIDPRNKALLSLDSLIANQKTGFWQTLKSLF